MAITLRGVATPQNLDLTATAVSLPTGTTTGDVIQIVAPATPDATLANINFALVGTR